MKINIPSWAKEYLKPVMDFTLPLLALYFGLWATLGLFFYAVVQYVYHLNKLNKYLATEPIHSLVGIYIINALKEGFSSKAIKLTAFVLGCSNTVFSMFYFTTGAAWLSTIIISGSLLYWVLLVIISGALFEWFDTSFLGNNKFSDILIREAAQFCLTLLAPGWSLYILLVRVLHFGPIMENSFFPGTKDFNLQLQSDIELAKKKANNEKIEYGFSSAKRVHVEPLIFYYLTAENELTLENRLSILGGLRTLPEKAWFSLLKLFLLKGGKEAFHVIFNLERQRRVYGDSALFKKEMRSFAWYVTFAGKGWLCEKVSAQILDNTAYRQQYLRYITGPRFLGENVSPFFKDAAFNKEDLCVISPERFFLKSFLDLEVRAYFSWCCGPRKDCGYFRFKVIIDELLFFPGNLKLLAFGYADGMFVRALLNYPLFGNFISVQAFIGIVAMVNDALKEKGIGLQYFWLMKNIDENVCNLAELFRLAPEGFVQTIAHKPDSPYIKLLHMCPESDREAVKAIFLARKDLPVLLQQEVLNKIENYQQNDSDTVWSSYIPSGEVHSAGNFTYWRGDSELQNCPILKTTVLGQRSSSKP